MELGDFIEVTTITKAGTHKPSLINLLCVESFVPVEEEDFNCIINMSEGFVKCVDTYEDVKKKIAKCYDVTASGDDWKQD